jgi:hypothetical protein
MFPMWANVDVVMVGQRTRFRPDMLRRMDAIVLVPFWNFRLALLLDGRT